MKIYLLPGPTRLGSFATQFVEHDKFGYWLGTYHGWEPVSGKYNAVDRVRISPELYRSFVTEAHHNSAKYAKK